MANSLCLSHPGMRLAALLAVLLLGGCQSAYYGTLEQLGYHKRDLLISRVESARDGLRAAGTQFQATLDRFAAVVNVQGGELRDRHEALSDEYDASRDRAAAARKRIDAVDSVAGALFGDWQAELAAYNDAGLRRRSAQQLADARRRYDRLIAALRRAGEKMDPVLAAFGDQVLFLKHNLNAQAVASLQDERVAMEANVAALVRDLEAAIAEAEAFLQTLAVEPNAT
ncbi:MAG: DUF2959 domain-containing protein [Pseudomonadota bacterium]|nr:DUF2959 domain-containing protein [Pseudomonadota bacterium]